MTRAPRTRIVAVVLSLALAALALAATPAQSVTTLQPFYDLPNAQHPESVTYDPVTRDFFAGSVLAKGIVRVDGDTGATSQFVSPLGLPFASVTGLRADPARRTLWACNTEPVTVLGTQVIGTPTLLIQSGVAKLDLDTGALEGYFPVALTPGIGLPGHLCNDITIDDVGNAYVTESLRGRVVAIKADGSATNTIVTDSRLAADTAVQGSFGANGIAYSPVDGKVYVTNPANGRLFRFTPAGTTAASLTEVSLAEPVYGDGLIVDPTNGLAYAVSGAPGQPRAIKQIDVGSAAAVKPVATVPWPTIPREVLSPTAGTYAEGRFYVADAAFARLQGNPLADGPGLFFGVDLP